MIKAVNYQFFTSSGTYTPTSGMQYCIVEVQGGGGNGAPSLADRSLKCYHQARCACFKTYRAFRSRRLHSVGAVSVSHD